jgi:hypothetical protein
MALQAFSVGPFALVVLVCYIIAVVNIPLRYLGIASGLVGTFRSMGGSVGNAVFNTILQSIISQDLAPAVISTTLANAISPSQLELVVPATVNAAIGVTGAFSAVPDNNLKEVTLIAAFRQVYARGFQMVFYSTILFGVLAIILALFIRGPSIYLTNHTAIHMEGRKSSSKAQRGKADEEKMSGQDVKTS